MNNVSKLSLIIIILLSILSSCSDSIEKAITYNEVIVEAYSAISLKEKDLLNSILNNDTAKIDSDYNIFIGQINESKKNVENLGAFNGYSDFYDATINIFNLYERIAKDEIVELINFMPFYFANSESADLNSELDQKLLNIDNSIDEEFNKFALAQEKFAAKYSFVLE
ncbi:MAG: hypothetical protein PHT69_04750 [Bacteroidales bacterium]|nr:hypothetical protein [Bacteroidales bacterium]